MDPPLKFVIEAGCLTGIIVLAAVSTPILAGKRWGRQEWLRSGGLLVVGLLYLVVRGGNSDLFPLVIGATVFVVAVVGLAVGLALAWRSLHPGAGDTPSRQAGISFSNMGLFGLLAAGCAVAAAASGVALWQALSDETTFEKAPQCVAASSTGCRSIVDGTLRRTWSDGARGPYWISVEIAGGEQTIKIETGYPTWKALAPGEQVAITSWNAQVTSVSVVGGGTMETGDAPGFNAFVAAIFLVGSVLGLLLFGGFAAVNRMILRATTAGIEVDQPAA